jgi:A/G-specific adenine glycosylase
MQEIRGALLSWYDENRRDLPWRAGPGVAPDPYRVWISEVMLQQTRVETVRPYFERWMLRFPTLHALAAAPSEEVMKAWEGLGYYSRARNLHAAVREVSDRFGGEIPDDPAAFRALPGVGRYTSGAVLSIAFGRPEPVVDGNVRRVFARLADDPAPADRRLWEMAGEIVEGERPGDLNQALMELGATVCTPRSPRCGACPIAPHCAARAVGTQEIRPAPRRAGPVPRELDLDRRDRRFVRRSAGPEAGGCTARRALGVPRRGQDGG